MKELLKIIYKYIPLKKSLFTVIKHIYIPSKRIYQHLYFYDTFTVNINQREKFKLKHHGYELENELFWKGIGGWEKVTFFYWIKCSRKSKIILDIGANTGIFSLISKCVNFDAIIYSFEPIPLAFSYLEQNIKLNQFNINALPYAVSNYQGNGKIYLKNDTSFAYSVTLNKNTINNGNEKELWINVVRLDNFFLSQKINQVDLIKLDVETHEPEVLEGMGIFLEKFSPIIFIEVLNNECAQKVMRLIKNIPVSYVFFAIDEEKDITKCESLFQPAIKNYILIPESKIQILND